MKTLIVFALLLLAWPAARGFCKGTLYTPTAHESGFEPGPRYSGFFAPRGGALSFPVEGNQAGADLIAGLSFCRRPSNVSDRVTPGGFDAVQRHTLGALTQNSKEPLKGSQFRADDNSVSPISRIGRGFGIGASRDHCAPTDIGSSAIHIVGGSDLNRPFDLEASAGLNLSAREVATGYVMVRFPAVAGANPARFLFPVSLNKIWSTIHD